MGLKSLFDVPAPAKLNLFLHVIGRRPDGYHLLQSLFVLIDWADTLHFERRADGQIRRHDLGAALPPEDLCLKAARMLQIESGTSLGADISIDKRVPAGAGMGGGSSDAATTLISLNRLWALDWPRDRLQCLALRLGADVPFFVGGDNAFVEGIGEKLTPMQIAEGRFAVIKPPTSVATASIFSSPELVRDTAPVILAGFLGSADSTAQPGIEGTLDSCRNDLQPVAEAHCQEISEAVKWLDARHGSARMTGSGSAVFSRISTTGAATATDPSGSVLEALPAGWTGRLCSSLPFHPLRGWVS